MLNTLKTVQKSARTDRSRFKLVGSRVATTPACRLNAAFLIEYHGEYFGPKMTVLPTLVARRFKIQKP